MNTSFLPTSHANENTTNEHIESNVVFQPFTVDQVTKELKVVKTNKCGGPDGVPPILVKNCYRSLSQPLTVIFNRAFENSVVPDCWKIACITPVPKKVDPGAEIKFRPIACTSILLKVLEKLVVQRIRPKLEEKADDMQFAYKSKRSCVDAVATISHSILSSLDSGEKSVRCCFLDYSNAFGTVRRDTLLLDLRNAGVCESELKWFHDYFQERKQFTRFLGKSSTIKRCDSGVLQGAIASPPLFSLYTDSLKVENPGALCKYADDQALLQHVSTVQNSFTLQSNLNHVNAWSTSRNLLLNPLKCKEITFTLRRGTYKSSLQAICPLLQVSETIVENVESYKYLGVILSSDLSWHLHVLNIFNKLRRVSFFVRRLRSFRLPYTHLKQFITSCALPLILFCSPVVFCGLLCKDFVLLRRAVRMLSNSSGIQYNVLLDFIVEKHFSACDRLIESILNDSRHPLHPHLSKCKSKRNLRSSMTCMFARTTRYRNSVIPYLARYITSKEMCKNELISNFL